jgi:hypothetical protein
MNVYKAGQTEENLKEEEEPKCDDDNTMSNLRDSTNAPEHKNKGKCYVLFPGKRNATGQHHYC